MHNKKRSAINRCGNEERIKNCLGIRNFLLMSSLGRRPLTNRQTTRHTKLREFDPERLDFHWVERDSGGRNALLLLGRCEARVTDLSVCLDGVHARVLRTVTVDLVLGASTSERGLHKRSDRLAAEEVQHVDCNGLGIHGVLADGVHVAETQKSLAFDPWLKSEHLYPGIKVYGSALESGIE